MESLQPILAEHPFFRGMDESLLHVLAGCACNVRFEKGDVIFREGEEDEAIVAARGATCF